MPQIIAPVAVPVMPQSPLAHSQTKAADGGFAAVFHGQVSGKQATGPKNTSSDKQTAGNSQKTQDPSQTGTSAAGAAAVNNLQEVSPADRPSAAFPAGLEQHIAGDDATGKRPDASGLEKPLPQFAFNKNLTGRETATPQTAQRGGSFLMSELRRLVESHDARATVNLERGDKASLQDMPTLAVAESAPVSAAAIMASTAVATPKTKTPHSIAAPLSTTSESGQAASGKAMAGKREIAAVATASDKRQAAGQASRDGKAAERLPPASASDRAAATASNDDSVSGQVAAAPAASATATGSAASVARPGQPPAADVAMMQQVIDHIRDLPRPLPNRVSLQLHPAELGQLKINLTMQEGVIRASLVTQTVQAQEILEKHMPKLRSLLEKQGLALEDVRIAQEGNPITAPAFYEQGHSSPRGGDSGGKGKKTATDGEHGGFAQALAQADSH